MVALTEKLLDGPAAVEAVTGNRPHYSTFFRWTQVGVKTPDGRRIKLAFVKAGGKRQTTETAVREFFAETTEAAGAPAADVRTNRAREADIHNAEAELAASGF